MANYFVIGNKFRPYSFDELIKPYQMYKEEYDKQESKLSNLEDQAVAVQSIMGDTTEYKNFETRMQNASAQLATSGLNKNTQAELRNLRKDFRYLQQASAKYIKMQDDRKTIDKATNNTSIYFNDYNPASLLTTNADNTYINGEDVMKDSLAKSTSLGSTILNSPVSKRTSDGQNIVIANQRGFSSGDFYKAISTDITGEVSTLDNPLTKLRKELFISYGGDKLSPSKQKQLTNYIDRGIASSIQAPDIKVVGDDSPQRALQWAQVAKINAELNSPKGGDTTGSNSEEESWNLPHFEKPIKIGGKDNKESIEEGFDYSNSTNKSFDQLSPKHQYLILKRLFADREFVEDNPLGHLPESTRAHLLSELNDTYSFYEYNGDATNEKRDFVTFYADKKHKPQ